MLPELGLAEKVRSPRHRQDRSSGFPPRPHHLENRHGHGYTYNQIWIASFPPLPRASVFVSWFLLLSLFLSFGDLKLF